MTLGGRLRDLRVHHDPYLTQRQAAAMLNVSHVWLSKIEADRSRPTPEFLGTAAIIYGMNGGRIEMLMDEFLALLEHWQEAPPPDYNLGICDGRRG